VLGPSAKVCINCFDEKELYSFPQDRRFPGRYHDTCRKCLKEQQTQKETKVENTPKDGKTCPDCGTYKVIHLFDEAVGPVDSRTSICSLCLEKRKTESILGTDSKVEKTKKLSEDEKQLLDWKIKDDAEALTDAAAIKADPVRKKKAIKFLLKQHQNIERVIHEL